MPLSDKQGYTNRFSNKSGSGVFLDPRDNPVNQISKLAKGKQGNNSIPDLVSQPKARINAILRRIKGGF
jgi:hypothetical protein